MRPDRVSGPHEIFECGEDGYMLPHEHLLLDLAPWWEGKEPFGSVVDDEGLTEKTLAAASQSPLEIVRENLILSDWVVLARELKDAKRFGLALVVDLTSEGLEPDRRHAVAAAKAADVELVSGIGHYREPNFAPFARSESADDRAARWLASWRMGFDDGIFPGIVGEIGTSVTLSADEHKSLIAAGVVSAETNAALSVHVEPFAATEEEIVRVLDSGGARRDRIVLSHCDVTLDEARLRSIVDLGTYVEFDQFGFPTSGLVRDQPMPSDADRIRFLEKMLAWGVIDRVLLSHDVCTRTQWARYGGNSYRHIGRVIRGQLTELFGSEIVELLS